MNCHPYPHPLIAGSRHELCSPRLLIHLGRPSSTTELNRPPEYFPITQLDLPLTPASPRPVPSSSTDLPSTSPSPCSTSSRHACLTLPKPFYQSSSFVGLLGPAPSPLPITPPPFNHHPMQTRSKSAIIKPNSRYDITIVFLHMFELYTIVRALQDPKWV